MHNQLQCGNKDENDKDGNDHSKKSLMQSLATFEKGGSPAAFTMASQHSSLNWHHCLDMCVVVVILVVTTIIISFSPSQRHQ